MFRNVLSSLNGSHETQTSVKTSNVRKAHANQLAASNNIHDHDDTSSTKSDDSEITMGNDNNNVSSKSKNSAMRMLSVKKGRKRLSSMMSRFGLSGGGGGAGGTLKSAGRAEEGAPSGEFSDACCNQSDDDDDDDDDAYKSAEEACRKVSLSDRQQQAMAKACEARRNSVLKRGRKSSQAPGGAGKSESASYEQLKSDKKYILPEEQCDIPTFLETKNCDPYLIEETRRLLKERFAKNPDNFYEADYERMLTDDWTVSRFLLRRRLEPKRTAKLMEECGRFRKQYKMSEVQLWEFPMEFHKAGGLFKYAPDRVGNVTMYMRVKMYRRVPEISDVFKAFILCVLEQCDVANNGRGTAVVFDLSACGLQNVDLGFLSWLLSSFRNYCPKGVSYIIVYNLPWILNATCKLAMTWMSASNKRALRFVYGDEIENFIHKRNLPDYLGGQCKLNYRAIPTGSRPAIEVCDRLDMTREQAIKIRELFKEYLVDDDVDSHTSHDHNHEHLQSSEPIAQEQQSEQLARKASTASALDDSKSHYDDAKSSSTSFENLSLDEHHHHTTNANGRAPVVELVSRASKFIAH